MTKSPENVKTLLYMWGVALTIAVFTAALLLAIFVALSTGMVEPETLKGLYFFSVLVFGLSLVLLPPLWWFKHRAEGLSGWRQQRQSYRRRLN